MDNFEQNYGAHKESTDKVNQAKADFDTAKEMAQAEPELAGINELVQSAIDDLAKARERYDSIIAEGRNMAQAEGRKLVIEAYRERLEGLEQQREALAKETSLVQDMLDKEVFLEQPTPGTESFRETLMKEYPSYREQNRASRLLEVYYQPGTEPQVLLAKIRSEMAGDRGTLKAAQEATILEGSDKQWLPPHQSH